jgi:hypothetical protein
MSAFDIDSSVINTQVPFFPSFAWGLTEADFGNSRLWAFNWLQAFWDTNDFTGTPGLVISTGETDASGNLICSLIQFAYSGERIPVKGKILLESGTDRRGQVITSTGIGGSTITDLTSVRAYGGNY